MAYLLRLATNGYAQLASTFSVAGTSSLSIKFKAAFTSGVASEIYGLGTSTAERLRYDGSGFFFRLNGGNGNTITTATIASLVSGYSVSNANEYELRKILFEDGSRTRYRLFVNGVDCGILMSIFGSGGDTFQFNRIGSASTAFMNGDLYYMDCFVGGVKTRSYDPSATGGSGSTLVDTTGSQNGTLNGTYSWVFYSSGGATYSGGAATSYAIDTVGGGLALRLGGAITTDTIDTVGGGSRITSSGASTSYALDSTGGGTRTTSAGAVTTYAIGTVGGGDVIKGATAYPGGAAVTFAAESTGGGVVIRGGGALLNFTAETTGGATRATSGGGAITVSLITVGGGDVLGPGYKPTITAPAVAVRRTYTGQGVRVVKTYRAPYTVATQKTFRGPTCRL